MPLVPTALRLSLAVPLAAAVVAWAAADAAHARSPAAAARAPGAVLAAAPLRHGLWIPGTRAAYRLRYVTTNARGRRAPSTGTVFLPKGRTPRGGWPVISWAHGTSGLGDRCAPSRIGPALPQRDRPYLAKWLRRGYAIVASDYPGLGTPGLMAYLHGRSTAHSVVDMVKAGRRYVNGRLRGPRLARRWVVVGQSQGGGAAIYTARYATRFGGRGLDYRGAVGTGVPAYIERVVIALGPGFPDYGPTMTSYMSYILTSLRYVYPGLGVDGILTATGRRYLKLAETACGFAFEERLRNVDLGSFFTRPLSSLPGVQSKLRDYLAMPERGFDRPFFMGHGTHDRDVPYALTEQYVAALRRNDQPVTFKTYDADHSGALVASQRDTIPFVGRLFARGAR